MSAATPYLQSVRDILDTITASQSPAIEQSAERCADAIAGGGLVHAFGSGHSRIIVEELWHATGRSLLPSVELSVTMHHQVVGTNGQRQALFIENMTGLAAQIWAQLRGRRT